MRNSINHAPYTCVSNNVLNHPDISIAAKGLYAYMMAQPDEGGLTIRGMADVLKEGQTAISSKLKELKKFGLIEYHKFSDGTGVYLIHRDLPVSRSKVGGAHK